MIGILIGVIIVLVMLSGYLADKIRHKNEVLEGYRIVVMEWHTYLHDKQYSEDFELWRKELEK